MLKQTKLPLLREEIAPPARKISQQNLDVLYNALVMILGINGGAGADTMIAVISSIHNNMVILLDDSPKKTIAYYKLLRRWFIEYVRGFRLGQKGFSDAEWDISYECPLLLKEAIVLLESIKSSKNDATAQHLALCQILVCLLDGHRVIVTQMEPQYGTITQPFHKDKVPSLPYMKEALVKLGITPDEFQRVYKAFCAKHKFHVITTAGPNGQATWSAHEDAIGLLHEVDASLNLFQYLRKSGLEWITHSLLSCVKAPEELSKPSGTRPIGSRLHAIEEWGGKTRIVAILDYFTQHALWPLHDTINHFLAKIPQDGTFDQDKIARRVKAWTASTDKEIYSYDLTAATDRLPIAAQVEILAHLFDDFDMADNWAKILTARRFYLGPDTPEFVQYKVGQPMGAKSSFAMLALLHHVITIGASLSAGVNDYKDYVVLGDDNTQCNSLVATKYVETMSSLGVVINEDKSVIHRPEPVIRAAEICKRVFVGGSELTALAPKLIVKTNKFGYMAPNLQNLIHTRGYPIPESRVLEFFTGLVDKRSLEGILVMNACPSSVTGIRKPLDSGIETLKPKNWFPKIQLTEKDIIQAYTFALVTEQLKRVDALLKGTAIISDLLATKVNKDPWMNWLSSLHNLSTEEVVRWHQAIPDLHGTHPVVMAATAEMQRVLDAMAALRSGNSEMVAQARRGLLDILRNSLSEVWEGEADRTGAARRSVFNRMLSVLNFVADEDNKKTITFSLLLTSVQRMWSVHWMVGEELRINMVKSKVRTSTIDNSNRLKDIASKIKLSNFRV